MGLKYDIIDFEHGGTIFSTRKMCLHSVAVQEICKYLTYSLSFLIVILQCNFLALDFYVYPIY